MDYRYLALEQYKDASHLSARIHLHQQFSTNPYGWFKWVFDQLRLPPDSHVLELGSGPGTLWMENEHRIPSGWHVTLSDFSPGMVLEAKNHLDHSRKDFTFEVSNGMAIPFPKETFDVIIGNHVLFHFPDRVRALGEITRVLKPDGQLFASTNGENHMLELSQIMDRAAISAGKHYSPAFSAAKFTLENGSGQLKPFFKHVAVHHYDDALVITETQPLVAYILSMVPHGGVIHEAEFIENLSRHINNLIKQNGAVNIQKSTGLFICDQGVTRCD